MGEKIQPAARLVDFLDIWHVIVWVVGLEIRHVVRPALRVALAAVPSKPHHTCTSPAARAQPRRTRTYTATPHAHARGGGVHERNQQTAALAKQGTK